VETTENNFYTLSPNELLSLNLLLTILFANGLNSNQLNILGNFICAVGQNILSIQTIIDGLPDENAVYLFNQTTCDAKIIATSTNQELLTELQKEVLALKAKLLQIEKELPFKYT
jgi:hypothetical protein